MSRAAAKILVFKKEIPMLVNCTQCGSRIAYTAKTCPRCGAEDSAKLPTYEDWRLRCWCSVIAIIICFVVILIPWLAIVRIMAMPGIFKVTFVGIIAFVLFLIGSKIPTRAKYDKEISK